MYSILFLTALTTAAHSPGQVVLPQAADVPPGISSPVPVETRLRPVPRSEDVVLRWNEVVLQAIKAERTPPPQATRYLAMVHAAVYDAVNSVDRTHTAYRVALNPSGPTSTEAAAAVAAHRILVSLYPRQVDRFDDALDASLEGIADEQARERGVRLGQEVAEAMLAWRAADGAQRQVAHASGTTPGVWRRTPPGFLPPLVPQWPTLTPFAMTGPERFRPAPPPALTSAEYAAAFNDVKELGARDSVRRTPEQTVIARFWADGDGTVTPPGHWNRIAQTVARERGTSLAENARLFALLNLTLADAGILCWDCKYRFNFWRPITAIREADRDGNPATESDPDWTPLLTTPPFPTYTSGHSTFSGAAASVLAHFFGSDAVRFTSTSEGTPGVSRTFERFSAAAEEAGRSRIYGGIHYEFDNQAGLASGRALADHVCTHFLLPWPGSAVSSAALPASRRK